MLVDALPYLDKEYDKPAMRDLVDRCARGGPAPCRLPRACTRTRASPTAGSDTRGKCECARAILRVRAHPCVCARIPARRVHLRAQADLCALRARALPCAPASGLPWRRACLHLPALRTRVSMIDDEMEEFDPDDYISSLPPVPQVHRARSSRLPGTHV